MGSLLRHRGSKSSGTENGGGCAGEPFLALRDPNPRLAETGPSLAVGENPLLSRRLAPTELQHYPPPRGRHRP